MSGVFIFILGMATGGLIGITFMCCLQINRIRKYEAETRRLRQKAKQYEEN